MARWRRRIRGAVGMGLTWALAWFAAGVAMAVFVIGLEHVEEPFPIVFGFLGFLAGAAFSVLLGLVEGRRRFDEMSLPRFAGWGAAGGLLLATFMGITTGFGTDLPTLAIVFWMTVLTTLVMSVLAISVEHARWQAPTPGVWATIAFNAVMIFGFAQPVWLYLARALPPVASTLSVMLIPVLGTLSGAWWLNEQLHWQDFAAIALMLAAIASVLLPARSAQAS